MSPLEKTGPKRYKYLDFSQSYDNLDLAKSKHRLHVGLLVAKARDEAK